MIEGADDKAEHDLTVLGMHRYWNSIACLLHVSEAT